MIITTTLFSSPPKFFLPFPSFPAHLLLPSTQQDQISHLVFFSDLDFGSDPFLEEAKMLARFQLLIDTFL